MDGSMANDWTSRSGIEEKQLALFAMSYSVSAAAVDTAAAAAGDEYLRLVLDTCAGADSAVICTLFRQPASVHQAVKLVAPLLRVAGVTDGLAESNGSLPPGL